MDRETCMEGVVIIIHQTLPKTCPWSLLQIHYPSVSQLKRKVYMGKHTCSRQAQAGRQCMACRAAAGGRQAVQVVKAPTPPTYPACTAHACHACLPARREKKKSNKQEDICLLLPPLGMSETMPASHPRWRQQHGMQAYAYMRREVMLQNTRSRSPTAHAAWDEASRETGK